MGEERFLKELHQVATGLFAGRDRRPNAFVPIAALLATSALCDFSIKNHEPNRLFSQIVGRVDTWRGDELEERRAVLAKPLCHISRLARRGNPVRGLGKNRFPGGGQTTFDRVLGEFVAAMKRAKHFADSLQQALAVGLRRLVRKDRQILYVADQMGQAELHAKVQFTHVFAIGAEVIAAQHAIEVGAQHLVQNLTAT